MPSQRVETSVREGAMRKTRWTAVLHVLGVLSASFAFQSDGAAQQQGGDAAIRAGATDIAGVVTSSKGAEAGVWVIAETTELPTKFAKIVVTDERGRYLIPDLPKA